ncbi:MAG: putative nuclease YhcG [Chlamydiales bacterium]|nr:putative nuclease YhcG [Chlamydiales bacterium]
MRAFYLAYEKVSQAVRQFKNLPVFSVPWGHNVILVSKLKDTKKRLWYAQQTIENGWSRSVLEMWIENDLYKRKGKAISNFKKTLPSAQSDLVQQTLKDPYCFDFLSIGESFREKEIEQGLVDHIQKFLTELGTGFAFMGRQYPFEIEGETFYMDLLFYHVKLRCYVVIELKAKEFDPRDAGQMNFYLSAVDDLMRHPDDQPSIGILLCKSKKQFKVEYALRDIKKPIGVSGYETKIVESLPKNLKGNLPTVKEIEAELEEKKKRSK